MDFLTTFKYVGVMISVIFAAYITTRWIAKKSNGMTQGKYINLVDRIFLGKDKSIFIVRVGGKIQLMGDNEKGTYTIAQLNEVDLIPLEKPNEHTAFSDVINRFMGVSKPPKSKRASSLSEIKNRASNSVNEMVQRNNKGDRKYE